DGTNHDRYAVLQDLRNCFLGAPSDAELQCPDQVDLEPISPTSQTCAYVPTDLMGLFADSSGTPPDPGKMVFRDLDGDGRTDILAAVPQGDHLRYFMGRMKSEDATGNLAVDTVQDVFLDWKPCQIFGDFNGDGYTDEIDLRRGLIGEFDGARFLETR